MALLSGRMLNVFVRSMLRDRNCEMGEILTKTESKKTIKLTIKDKGDEITIKRDVKEAIEIYWNEVISREYEEYITRNCIIFPDFQKTFNEVIEDSDRNDQDMDDYVEQALRILGNGRLTGSISRVEKSHNSEKKKEEIHGKEKEEKKNIKDKSSVSDKDNKKIQILLALNKRTPYKYKAREFSKLLKMDSKECTKLIEELLSEGKIIMLKKGKDGIYNSTLDLEEKIKKELESDKKDKKATGTVVIGNTAS